MVLKLFCKWVCSHMRLGVLTAMLTAVFRTCKNSVLKKFLLSKIICFVSFPVYYQWLIPPKCNKPFSYIFMSIFFSVLMKKYFSLGKSLIKKILACSFLHIISLFLSPLRLCHSFHSPMSVELCRIKAKGSEVSSLVWRYMSVVAQVLF